MKRILCLLLAVVMLFTIAPVNALAASKSKLSYVKQFKVEASASATSITLFWSVNKKGVKAIKGFDIYRSVNGGRSKYIGKVKAKKPSSKGSKKYNYSFKDKPSSIYAYVCNYEIWPYYKDKKGKKKHLDEASGEATASFTSNSLMTIKTTSNKVTVNMQKLPNKPKYIIRYTKYKLFSSKKYSPKYYTTKKRKFTIKNVNTKDYGYIIDVMPSWKRAKPKKAASGNTHDFSTMFNNQTAYQEGKIDVINTKGQISYIDWTYTVSSRDKQIIAAFFESVYHGNYPSKYEMAKYALDWIHMNVAYAYDYSSIESKSYVEAIFLYKKGQCLQYNGAFAAVLNYLGYKSRIIEGYRKGGIQHFWCEAYVNGHWYVCETGNYGKNGNWKHFMKPYSQAGGYTKNGLPATDD